MAEGIFYTFTDKTISMAADFLQKPIPEALLYWESVFKELDNKKGSEYFPAFCSIVAKLLEAELVIIYRFNNQNKEFRLDTNRPEVSNISPLAGWLEKILVETSSPASELKGAFHLVLRHFDILPTSNYSFTFTHTVATIRYSIFAASIPEKMATWLNNNTPFIRFILRHYLGLQSQIIPTTEEFFAKVTDDGNQLVVLEIEPDTLNVKNQISDFIAFMGNNRNLLQNGTVVQFGKKIWKIKQSKEKLNQWYFIDVGENSDIIPPDTSDYQHKIILEQFPQGILVLNDRGYIEYANATIAAYLDSEPTKLLGKHVGRFFANTDYQKIVFEQFRQQQGNIQNFAMQVLTATNILRPVIITSRKLTANKIAVFVEDAQTQISLEQQLRRKENEFNRIAQNPKILFAKISFTGEIVESNVQLAKQLGFTQEGLVGKNLLEYIVNPEFHHSTAVWERFINGTITQYELTLQAPNLSPLVWLTTIQTVGEKLWFIGINATEFRKVEQTALTQGKMIQTILENLPIGVMVLKRNYQVIFSNIPDFSSTKKQLFCHHLLTKSDEICAGCQLHSTFDTRQINRYQIEDTDSVQTYQIIDVPIENENGDIEFVIEFFIDITEQVQTNRKLKEAHEASEKASKLKTLFLQNINHEIRNPLNAIMGFSKLLMERNRENESQRSMFEFIHNNGKTLLDTISKLIELSQLQCGDYTFSTELFNLNKTLEKIATEFSDHPKIVTGVIRFNMMQPNFQIWLRTDKNRIQQIVEQLLINAIRFTDQGNVSLIIDFTSDFVVISVTDNSPVYEGSPDQLFEYFGKETLTKHPWQGAGIGLSLAYRNALALGGSLSYNPDYTKGCRFDLKLPRSLAETQETMTIPTLSWSSKTILIVEDDFSSYLYLKDMLAETGIEIRHATNGREALRLLSPEIDLILLDIYLPVIDGLEVTQKIREQGISVPIVAITANPYSERQCIESGCNYFITKPVSSITLLPILQHYLD